MCAFGQKISTKTQLLVCSLILVWGRRQPRPDYAKKMDGDCNTALQLMQDSGSTVENSVIERLAPKQLNIQVWIIHDMYTRTGGGHCQVMSVITWWATTYIVGLTWRTVTVWRVQLVFAARTMAMMSQSFGTLHVIPTGMSIIICFRINSFLLVRNTVFAPWIQSNSSN